MSKNDGSNLNRHVYIWSQYLEAKGPNIYTQNFQEHESEDTYDTREAMSPSVYLNDLLTIIISHLHRHNL